MELKERIAGYQKQSYNKFYWWRRFQPRQTLTRLHRLEQRVPNGDFEVSDYYWQAMWETELEKQAIANEVSPDKRHELRCMYGERRRRLNNDYEKDEAKILEDMYRAFRIELRMTRDEVEEEMLNFDGTLSEFYYYIYDKKNKMNGALL
jgi:hypothetical protein